MMHRQESSTSSSPLFEGASSDTNLPGVLQDKLSSSCEGFSLSDYEVISLQTLSPASLDSTFNSDNGCTSDDSSSSTCSQKASQTQSPSLLCCFLNFQSQSCSSEKRCCQGGLTMDVIDANSIVYSYTAPEAVSRASRASLSSNTTQKCSWNKETRSGSIINSLLSSPLTSLSCFLCGKSFRDGEKLRSLFCLDVFHQTCIDRYFLADNGSAFLSYFKLTEKKSPKCPKCGRRDIFTKKSIRNLN